MLDNKETTQNYFKGLTRKDYIERVCKIMEKDGAEDLSIRRIAKELGCSSAALYRYFNSNLCGCVVLLQPGGFPTSKRL